MKEIELVLTELHPVKGKHSKLSILLNKYFRHIDRGGSLKGEILAGITLFIVSVCILFMNIQFIANSMNEGIKLSTSPDSPVNTTASMNFAYFYIGALLVSFLGTILVGLVVGYPLVQVTMMGFGSGMLSMFSIENGLTYYNLLFINLIAAAIYFILTQIPFMKKIILLNIPEPVKKVLPLVIGVIFAFNGLKFSGLVSLSIEKIKGIEILSAIRIKGIIDLSTISVSEKYAIFGAFLSIIIYILFKVMKWKNPLFWSLIIGTLLYVTLDLCLVGADVSNADSYINLGRVWMAVSSQASNRTPFGDSFMTYMPLAISSLIKYAGNVITIGSDFSAYNGNVSLLLLNGIVTFIIISMTDVVGIVSGVTTDLSISDDEITTIRNGSVSKAIACNAAINIIAPFLGIGNIAFGGSSLVGAEEDGKSGLTSIVASIGILLSVFILLIPALFATKISPVMSMNQWNYNAYGNGGFITMISNTKFLIINVIMLCIGIGKVIEFINLNFKDKRDYIPSILTLVCAVYFMNLMIGLLVGIISYVVLKKFLLPFVSIK